MSKLKALILGILILVPLFVFIFIYTFGEHHFGLKSYFPMQDASGAIVYNANGDTVFQQVADFSLIDQQGKAFTKQDLRGKMYMVNFFHTDCPYQCRKMTSQVLRVQEAFKNNPDVELVSVTVKPETDSPDVLATYADSYNADTTMWHFVTGNRNDIYSLAQQSFKMPLRETVGENKFIHEAQLMLVDKDHVVRGIYDATDVLDVDRLILEINILLDEYSKNK